MIDEMSDHVQRGPCSVPLRHGRRTYHVRYRADMAEKSDVQAGVHEVPSLGDRIERKLP